jgi:FixJ family two-component response regulator
MQEMIQRKAAKTISQDAFHRHTRLPVVAIVDDDKAVRESISSLIRSIGYSAVVFPSAEVFLNSRGMAEMGCLILDVRMPGLSGLELQSKLAGMDCTIPIIFATAQTDANIRTLALHRGAVGFLHKPFSDEALFEAMRLALT